MISTGTLTANATAADIATAFAADTDVNSSSGKYTVTASEGKVSITRTDGVQFTVTKQGTGFPADAKVVSGLTDLMNANTTLTVRR